jgi:hypothetical protein
MNQTLIKFDDAALAGEEEVVLFDSTVACKPGGWFHLLGQQWFQYSLVGTGDTGTVTGSFSLDKGATWVDFYSSATSDGAVAADEVYVGLYKDVQFTFAAGATAVDLVANLALHCAKPTSKVTAADVLHDNTAAAAAVVVDTGT